MKDTPIILSISMLISGRDEMKKSLDSLHYFTEAFPCEVILVDTGCSPEQRELAARYADKIVDFEWCNDFAAARNAGLKEAKGEWFMYLDDDEWFDNPQQMVAFFTSGEYKNYKSASYTVRNYRDLQGKEYSDSYLSRLVKRLPETEFVGKIHEYLQPYEKPKKTFTDFVHHYGYAYKDEEDRKEHSYRNIKPLLELRKEQPGEPRWMCQLAQEYFTLRDYEEVIKVCQEGLEEWSRYCWDHEYTPSHVGGLYVYILIAMETLKRYKEEEVWLKKAFADMNMQLDIMAPTVAFLCLLGTKLYDNLKDYRKSKDYLRRYIDYAKRLEGDRAILESGGALIVTAVFQKTLLYSTILTCLEAAIRTEDYKLCEDAFYMLDWQEGELLNQNEQEKIMVDAFCCVSYHPTWVKLLQTLVSRPGGMDEMLAVFLEIESEYKQQGEMIGGEKLSRLHRLVAELDYEHGYVMCARILYEEECLNSCRAGSGAGKTDPGAEGSGAGKTDPDAAGSGVSKTAPGVADSDVSKTDPGAAGISEAGFRTREAVLQKIEALFEELFDKYQDEILAVGAEVWNVAERQGIALKSRLLQVDYRNWKRMLERWCRTTNLWEIKQWEERLTGWRQQPDESDSTPAAARREQPVAQGDADAVPRRLHFELFAVKCVEGYLRRYREVCPNLEKLEPMLWKYADSVLAFYTPYYKDFVFSQRREILPDEAQLALCLKELQQYREEGNDLKALESARKCLGICPAVEEAVDTYAKMLRDDVQKRNQEAGEAQAELRRLIATLKKAARMQIGAGQYQAAKDILLQVQQCAPGDAEVQELLEQADGGLKES